MLIILEVGKTVVIDDIKMIVEKDYGLPCNGCYFEYKENKNCLRFNCDKVSRTDGTNVILKETTE